MKPNAWISDNDLLKLLDSVDDARNIRMSTTRTHLRVHPIYIPGLVVLPEERCESGDPECGPVEFHDSEGVPLCRVCWDGLIADSAEDEP